jgi:hypothetical protein
MWEEAKQTFVDFKHLRQLAADDDAERNREIEALSPGSERTGKVEL